MLEVVQQDQVPSVYLDHWALRRLSTDLPLGRRFAAAIESSDGTLYLSGIGVLEFSRITDMQNVALAEELLQSCVPRLFFLESNPWKVVSIEDRLIEGASATPPHADLSMASLIPTLRPDGLQPWGVRGLFEAVRASESLRDAFDSFGLTVATKLGEFQARGPARFNQAKGSALQRATRFVLTELVRLCVTNRSMRLSVNDGIDLFHAAVPASYANILVLDRRWKSLVEQAIRRLRKIGHSAEFAEVLSGQEALAQTLEMLEGWGNN